MDSRLFSFVGGMVGDRLPTASRSAVIGGLVDPTRASGVWHLHGIIGNERYVTAQEKAKLLVKQEGLGRPTATCAALIPIRKNSQ